MPSAITTYVINALRTLHWISACGWIGGGLAVLILLKLAGAPTGQEEAEVLQRSIIAVDDYLIIPSAGISATSGVTLCYLRRWGWSKHRWIKEKCIITAILLLFGAFWLAPDLRTLLPAGLDFETDLGYHRHWLAGSIAAAFQTLGLFLLLGLSILKPEKAPVPQRRNKN